MADIQSDFDPFELNETTELFLQNSDPVNSLDNLWRELKSHEAGAAGRARKMYHEMRNLLHMFKLTTHLLLDRQRHQDASPPLPSITLQLQELLQSHTQDIKHTMKDTITQELSAHYLPQYSLTDIESTVRKIVKEDSPNPHNFQCSSASIPPRIITQKPPSDRTIYSKWEKCSERAIIFKKLEPTTSLQAVQNVLNTTVDTDYGVIDLFRSRSGNLVLKCDTQENLQDAFTALQNVPEIKEIATVHLVPQAKVRLIVFNVPDWIADEEEFRSWFDWNLDESQQSHSSMILIRKMNSKREGFTNYVIDLSPTDARKALNRGKIMIGCNGCIIHKYIAITRCYNCQRVGHLARNCKHEETCGHCASQHSTRTCPNTSLAICANCSRIGANSEIANGHKAFFKGCPYYKRYLSERLSKQT